MIDVSGCSSHAHYAERRITSSIYDDEHDAILRERRDRCERDTQRMGMSSYTNILLSILNQ